jgi:hypothetical protein
MDPYTVHSEVWPFSPQEARYGYTPTFQRGPLLRQPLGVPVIMSGTPNSPTLSLMQRHGGRSRRRLDAILRAAQHRANTTGRPVRLIKPELILMHGSDTVYPEPGYGRNVAPPTPMGDFGGNYLIGRSLNPYPTTTGTTTSAPSATSSSTADFGDEHIVPAGRDPETHFRQLGFSSQQARRLAEAPASQREAMMHEYGYRRQRTQQTLNALGGVLSSIGREARDFFRPAQQAAPRTEVVYREAAPQGMSMTTMALLGAAGLAGAFLLMKAGGD